MEKQNNDKSVAISNLKAEPTEEKLWQTILAYQGESFFTASGLPFTYTVKIGRNGQPNKELVIDRRENSKTLTWGSIRLAFHNALQMQGEIVKRPKSLGDIRGVSYIYPLLWRFGLICVPEKTEEKLRGSS